MAGGVEAEDWSDPGRIPLGYAHMRPAPGETPDPRYLQTNLFTLSQIGGLYDLIALHVEKDHLSILAPWRLDSGACSVVDYLEHNNRRRREN